MTKWPFFVKASMPIYIVYKASKIFGVICPLFLQEGGSNAFRYLISDHVYREVFGDQPLGGGWTQDKARDLKVFAACATTVPIQCQCAKLCQLCHSANTYTTVPLLR